MPATSPGSFAENHGREPVHGRRALLNADSARAEHAARLNAGQALVPVFDRQAGSLFDGRAELAHPTGLAALAAAHVYRVAHEDQADFALGREALEGIQIVTLARAFEIRQSLRGNSQRIADGQPNALLAQVQGENAGLQGSQVNSL